MMNKSKMEEKLMIKKLKNEKAITLIALVVTIIVLIILASISINLVLGENGIITKAKDTRDETGIASQKEQLLFSCSNL